MTGGGRGPLARATSPETSNASAAPPSVHALEAAKRSANQTGSSLMASNVMNPQAAQALYAGDTDAALAYNAGQPRYAAGGGLMQMNPIMDNQGKYTTPQTSMNDNPFLKQAKEGGIMSVL